MATSNPAVTCCFVFNGNSLARLVLGLNVLCLPRSSRSRSILGRFEESIPTRNALSFEQRSRREILPCAISRRVRRQIRFFLTGHRDRSAQSKPLCRRFARQKRLSECPDVCAPSAPMAQF